MLNQVSNFRKNIYYSMIVVIFIYFLFYFLRSLFGFLPHDDGIYDVFLFFGILFLFLLYKKQKSAFYIDTDGEAITIQLKEYLSFSELSHNFKGRKEFPKYKLNDFHLEKSLLGNQLVFELNSKRSPNKKQKIYVNIIFFSSDVTKEILKALDFIKNKNIENSSKFSNSTK